MSSGYYDDGPTHRLRQSVVVVAMLDETSRAVGRTVAALIGARFLVLDDAVAHRMGASVRELVDERGLAEWRELESAELSKALEAAPPGVLVLGEGTLSPPTNRRRALARSAVVYLEQSYEEVEQALAFEPQWRHPTLWAEANRIPGTDTERLRALYSLRDGELSEAPLRVPVGGRSHRRVAREALDALERAGAATPL